MVNHIEETSIRSINNKEPDTNQIGNVKIPDSKDCCVDDFHNMQTREDGAISSTNKPVNRQQGVGNHSGFKRPINSTVHSERKRMMYGLNGSEREKRTVLPGQIHGRWLIESYLCARVLGPGGKRLKSMKVSTKEQSLTTWISSNVPKARFRVFNCIGSPMAISKIAGLFVKAIHEEPEFELSGPDSKCYDMKFLIPKVFVIELAGPNNTNFHEVEERSNSIVGLDSQPLKGCDEHCVHIYGVADAVQIAVYFTLKTLQKIYEISKFNLKESKLILFCPELGLDLPRETTEWAATSTLNSSDYKINDDNGDIRENTNKSKVSSEQNISSSQSQDSNPGSKRHPFTYLLPGVQECSVSPSIHTAFDIAIDSNRGSLRQMIPIPSDNSNEYDREFLVENIRRVTDCSAEIISTESSSFTDSSEPLKDVHEVSVVIEGHPSENLLALFLIYRFLVKNIKKTKS